jgi:xylulokinase
MGYKGKYLFGIDIGTEHSKGAITDLDGNIIATHTCSHGVSRPKPGWVEHDADEVWWKDFKTISKVMLEKAMIDPKEIAAIGISAILPVVLPVDQKGNPLRPAILYGCDTRTSEEIKILTKIIGQEKIIRLTGADLNTNSVGPKIYWLQRHEADIFKKAAKFICATSYLIFKLTGNYVIDYNNASGFDPLYDLNSKAWNEDICAVLGIKKEQLPEIYSSQEVIGRVTARVAKETGLSEGTQVIAGTGDANAEFMSTAPQIGDTVLTWGSTFCFLSLSDKPLKNNSLKTAMTVGYSSLYNAHLTGGGMSTSASITKWFRDNFGKLEMEIEEKIGINAYDLLIHEAEQVPPGSDGLVLLPYFSGERSPIWDNKARGLLLGLTLSHTKSHVYRAILEGVAYGVKHNIDEMSKAGVEIKNILSVGGGTRSRLWTEIVSDVTGIKQKIISSNVGSHIGDCYLAGIGIGLFKGLNTLRDVWLKKNRIVRPNMINHKIYKEYYKIYRRLYPVTKDAMHKISDLNSH